MLRITIVLAYGQQLLRVGLRALLETQPDFVIIGEATDGLEAAALVEQLRPDVLIVDLTMRGLSGFEVARQVKESVLPTRVVGLAHDLRESEVVQALRSGVSAIVAKVTCPAALVRGIHEAHAGRAYLSPPLSMSKIDDLFKKAKNAPSDPYETLTRRERQVLHLAAEGVPTPQIAARLGIGRRTVETYRTSLMGKLALHNQIDLMRYALARGIIAWDE